MRALRAMLGALLPHIPGRQVCPLHDPSTAGFPLLLQRSVQVIASCSGYIDVLDGRARSLSGVPTAFAGEAGSFFPEKNLRSDLSNADKFGILL